MEPIRLGILGPGRIFHRVVKDFPNAKNIRATAVASRSEERAREAAALCGAEHVFTDYRQLAECPDVDLVYICTPNPFHLEQACMCMNAGKHVICEKPMALNAEEVRVMRACAEKNHVFLMEAMWSRFFPAIAFVREQIAAGAIGEVRHVTAQFSSNCEALPDSSRIWDLKLGGGGLLDLGVYCIEAATDILGYDPQLVQGACRIGRTGVDARFAVQMLYKNGATAQLLSGSDMPAPSTEVIYGSHGTITIPDFWHPTRVEIQYGRNDTCTRVFPPEFEGFHHEFDHAAQCIREGRMESPRITLDETEAVAGIMARLRYEQGIVFPQERN